MSAKQKAVHGRGPSNINLGQMFAPLKFAGVHNHFLLLTMIVIDGALYLSFFIHIGIHT